MTKRFIKIGAVILDENRRLLAVRKARPGEAIFIIPGGKPEGTESDEEACRRELQEEVGLEVISTDYLGTFVEPAEFGEGEVELRVYRTQVTGTPVPQSEIAEFKWVDRHYAESGVTVGSVLALHVIPLLISEGSM